MNTYTRVAVSAALAMSVMLGQAATSGHPASTHTHTHTVMLQKSSRRRLVNTQTHTHTHTQTCTPLQHTGHTDTERVIALTSVRSTSPCLGLPCRINARPVSSVGTSAVSSRVLHTCVRIHEYTHPLALSTHVRMQHTGHAYIDTHTHTHTHTHTRQPLLRLKHAIRFHGLRSAATRNLVLVPSCVRVCVCTYRCQQHSEGCEGWVFALITGTCAVDRPTLVRFLRVAMYNTRRAHREECGLTHACTHDQASPFALMLSLFLAQLHSSMCGDTRMRASRVCLDACVWICAYSCC